MMREADLFTDWGRPHTLSADELHTAYLTPYLQQATTMLEERVRSTQAENGVLMQRITDQRAEMEALVGGLEGVVADLEGSVEAMGGVDGLRAEIWEMDGEVQASGGR
jgi:kinetochore protein NNF1